MNFSPAFFCSAPGSRPASVRTWKPLQMPTTGPAGRGEAAIESMTGEKRAIAPGAEVVAVGEPARHHHRVDAAEVASACQSRSVEPPRCYDRALDVELAVRARELHDSDRSVTPGTPARAVISTS